MADWFVIPNKAGYAPSENVLRRLQSKARRMGRISDWKYVQVFEDGGLMLSLESINSERLEEGDTIIAIRGKHRRWYFQTDSQYMSGSKEVLTSANGLL